MPVHSRSSPCSSAAAGVYVAVDPELYAVFPACILSAPSCLR